jgi:hypothetical protein
VGAGLGSELNKPEARLDHASRRLTLLPDGGGTEMRSHRE